MFNLMKTTPIAVLGGALLAGVILAASPTAADGIVAKVVNSPLNSAGLVRGGYSALNVYLQKPEALGVEFFNPEIPGYGIPPGGRIEVEMGGGFTRDPAVPMDASAVHMVSGTPQHGLSSKAYGYGSHEGANANTFVLTASTPEGLPADKLLPRATIEKLDPIPNIGLKVFHIGLGAIAFTNRGDKGSVTVRIVDGNDKVLASGSAEVEFWDETRPQIHPNNFLHKGQNHNWQRVEPGGTPGKVTGTVPLTFMLFDKSTGTPDSHEGIVGAGIVSVKQLKEMNFTVPAEIARYNNGLIVKDRDGDGRLDPNKDQIIGGVISGDLKGYDVRSLEADGAPVLSQATRVFSEGAGKRFGGSVMQVFFHTDYKAGTYRPTFALLKDPTDLKSGDGTSYTYTVIAEKK
jgi:hypothetical protein